MDICFHPIGHVRTDTPDSATPHHWSASDIEGTLDIHPRYREGARDIQAGQKIVVLFHFDRSPPFGDDMLTQIPRQRRHRKGVFSICTPRRPNAIGMSVLSVLSVDGGRIRVKGVDMFDGTPILDIKPHVAAAE